MPGKSYRAIITIQDEIEAAVTPIRGSLAAGFIPVIDLLARGDPRDRTRVCLAAAAIRTRVCLANLRMRDICRSGRLIRRIRSRRRALAMSSRRSILRLARSGRRCRPTPSFRTATRRSCSSRSKASATATW